ncbi:MAG: hypothetical protein IMF05_10970 [Proteobacteria bacterium]|nr:hypothetical protein [Pseudomonadota bacterium]
MTQGAHIVRKEMGYTHKEFMRLLPKAVGGADMRITGNEIAVREGDRSLRIELGEEGERRIANLRLPMTPVSLAFTGYNEAEIDAALDRFWRAYQKGGG